MIIIIYIACRFIETTLCCRGYIIFMVGVTVEYCVIALYIIYVILYRGNGRHRISAAALVYRAIATALYRTHNIIHVYMCECVPEQVLKNLLEGGLIFFSIKNHFHCAMFSFRESKTRTGVAGRSSLVRASTAHTSHTHTQYIIILLCT